MLQEAVFTQSEKSIADKVFTTYDMTGTPGLTAQIPVYPEIAAQEQNQTTEVTDTNFTVTQVDVTAAEIQARIDVSDLLAESTIRNMGSDVGQMIGSAIGEKVDTNAFSLFTEANIAQDAGDNATTITPAIILQGVYKLRENNAPTDGEGDYHCVIHPGQAYGLASALAGAGYGTSANAISNVGNTLLSSSAFVGKLFNVKIFQSTGIAADSVATDAQGCVFSPQAFAHVIKRSLRIESQRDASMRHTEYVGSTAVKTALVKAAYACRIKGSKVIG
jgi:N4-gp56 family major capsid protein